MASAQVLPSSAASSSSRKQGHLEAGKRRLEEFRKKKAEGRARKAASTGQLLSDDVNHYEKLLLDSERVSDGATSERDGVTITEPSGPIMGYGSMAVDSSQGAGLGSSNSTHAGSVYNRNVLFGDWMQNSATDEGSGLYESSGFSGPAPGPAHGYYDHWREKYNEPSNHRESGNELSDGVARERQSALYTANANANIGSSTKQDKLNSLVEEHTNSTEKYVKDPDLSEGFLSSLPEDTGSVSKRNTVVVPSSSANYNTSTVYDAKLTETASVVEHSMDIESVGGFSTNGRKISGSISRHLNFESTAWHTSESSSMSSSSTSKNLSNQHPLSSTISGTGSGRSRPSFLDSLNVPRVYSISHSPFTESVKAEPPVPFDSSKLPSAVVYSLSSSQHPFPEPDTVEPSVKRTQDIFGVKEFSMNSSVPINGGEPLSQGFRNNGTQGKQELPAMKKDDDFLALEQHIEDLTQEKFSLQRGLDSSRTLAESLASENSSLTDSFNQQGKVVNQLRSDMERLQEEIRAQLLALEAVKVDYANVQLECNAADERAKILASEVIGLEEKALKLRSSELKLEKQLENSNAEIASYKRKMSSLEKERRDFQSMIEALQEEKKLLQSMLRKASPNGRGVDPRKTIAAKKEASTSTADIETVGSSIRNTSQEIESSVGVSSGISNFSFLPENTNFNLQDASGAIPHDQLKMIDNISSLISELALEKEELLKALTMESSNNSKLKDLNKELSQKLETLTQRFELLTAQRMASENIVTRPIDTSSPHDTTEYTDEGDEVVERVLGWIMKLFPGGPAKRRTSKLL